MSLFNRAAWSGLALLLCGCIAGCGTPGAPQPPSLNLPNPVTDLAATRNGNQVMLTWTMPKRNTDKTAIKGDVTAQICRREGMGACNAVADKQVAPEKPASYAVPLQNALATGQPRPVSYFVELLNKKNRSAGLSNGATVLAGAAPGAVEGLKAEARKQGVVLSWAPDGEKSTVRLVRKLLTPPPAKSQQQGPLAPAPEALNQSMLVEAGVEQGRALDQTAHFNESYEYRAQRLVRVDVKGKTLELAGDLSAPIAVDVKDVFPPAVPVGLAAVASAGGDGKGPSIDVNWQPNTEADLAGYIVYRREDGGVWQRISPATLSIEPAFHDAQVQPGHSYEYTASAVDKGGHESERSEVAEETVPQS
ncbi:MAG TPA: hypothetical protein VGI45_18200 [Terracidiphilus sp.]|jgi:hypothetical protein